MKTPVISLVLAAMAMQAVAQQQGQLTKEITIDREIVPEIKASSRPLYYPQALTFTPASRNLKGSDLRDPSDVDASIATLEPAFAGWAAQQTPYRGYVDAGYFPAANFGLSAGYSIVANKATALNVHTQLSNRSWKARIADGMDKSTFKHFNGAFGIDFSHRFGAAGTLTASTAVDYASFDQLQTVWAHALPESEESVKGQNTLGWRLEALWRGQANAKLSYHIGAGFDIFNFGKDLVIEEADIQSNTPELTIPAIHQTGFSVNLGVVEKLSEHSKAGLDLDANFLHYNRFSDGDALAYAALNGYFADGEDITGEDPAETDPAETAGSKTLGVIGLNPYWTYAKGVATVRLGLLANYTANSGKKFHVAPDVVVGINPTAGFGASLRVGGGEQLNNLRQLVGFTPYVNPTCAYAVTNHPISAELSLRFGPVKGFSLTPSIAYEACNDLLLPYEADGNILFAPVDTRALKAGARLDWTFRNILAFEASFATTLGNSEKKTWSQWLDRTRHLLDVSLTVTPISRLEINLAYELRLKRSMPLLSLAQTITDFNSETGSVPGLDPDQAETGCPVVDLKDMGTLNLGASWRFTDAFTVFARVENLLADKALLLPGLQRQGISGLVGVGYKF